MISCPTARYNASKNVFRSNGRTWWLSDASGIAGIIPGACLANHMPDRRRCEAWIGIRSSWADNICNKEIKKQGMEDVPMKVEGGLRLRLMRDIPHSIIFNPLYIR